MNSKNIYQFHYDSLVIDTHSDFLTKALDDSVEFGNVTSNVQSGIYKLKDGGVDVQFFAVWVKPENERIKSARQFTVEQILLLNKIEIQYNAFFEIAKKLKDIGRIVSNGKVCGMIGIEDGVAIEDNLDNLGEFFELGVRYITLTWNNSNQIATSAMDEDAKTVEGGLTPFGKQVIAKMNELGIIVDISHIGEKSFWDVIKYSKQPIIASHSNAYSVYPHWRNLKDDQIRAIADNGGVIMVNFHNGFLTHSSDNNNVTALDIYKEKLSEIYKLADGDLIQFNILKEEFLKEKISKDSINVNNVLDHIDHIVNLVGPDHLGLGSDYDGGISPPFDLYDSTCYPYLTKKLFDKGYSENDIKKFLGLNLLRVFYTVCK